MFGKLVKVQRCAAMWTFQVLEEVGMCMGIMPITGIPLPFISYGATSMIAQLMAVGWYSLCEAPVEARLAAASSSGGRIMARKIPWGKILEVAGAGRMFARRV